MESMGYDFSTKTKEQLEEVQVIYFNRVPNRLDLVRQVTGFGTKLVMDLDDYWELYPEHPMLPWWKHNKMSVATVEMIKASDAVTCTTTRLADKIMPYNKNVFVIPNAAPNSGQFLSKEKIYNRDSTRFGYIGGSSHLLDIKRIAPVFRHFPTLDFTLFGYTPMPPARTHEPNVWDKIQAVCNFNGHNPNYKRVDSKDLSSYMEHYDQIDVAIAPLADNEFNRHKSSLKFYEAAAKGCAFVGSLMPPYSDDVPFDAAILCDKTKDWVDTFKRLKDPNLVQELGEAAHSWVREHRDMTKVNKLRTELFESLIK